MALNDSYFIYMHDQFNSRIRVFQTQDAGAAPASCSIARQKLETGFAHYKIEPVTLYRGMVLMVAQRSPKPLVWVQILVPLPYNSPRQHSWLMQGVHTAKTECSNHSLGTTILKHLNWKDAYRCSAVKVRHQMLRCRVGQIATAQASI